MRCRRAVLPALPCLSNGILFAVHESVVVQVFGRRQRGGSSRSTDRRPQTSKGGNRGRCGEVALQTLGDLAAVSPSTTFAIWHDLCERVKTPFAAPVVSES